MASASLIRTAAENCARRCRKSLSTDAWHRLRVDLGAGRLRVSRPGARLASRATLPFDEPVCAFPGAVHL